MHPQRPDSAVRPTRRTPGSPPPLALALTLAAVVGALLTPTESRADDCYCPDGMDSQGNPVTSTTCGEQVCGTDYHYYSCQESGWTYEGGSCNDPAGCSCTGTDHLGNPVTVNACGQQVCGADFQYYSCGETGWTALGTSCPGEPPPPSPCDCPNGWDYLGNPVSSTTCGEQVCGEDFQYYTCGETGWSAQGTACPEWNPAIAQTYPTLTPLDSAKITATIGISPTVWGINTDALQNQLALSNARVRLGQALFRRDSLPATAPERPAAENAAAAAEQKVAELMAEEASLPVDQVERARLPVFITRISQLETQYSDTPGYAVQLARQVYYNGGMYSAASGVLPLADMMIHRTGLPHGELHGDRNGGYFAEIRAPNGQEVDFGHVMTAVDFDMPYTRVDGNEVLARNSLLNYMVVEGVYIPLPNPVNHGNLVSVAGDLGTSAHAYLTGSTAWDALMGQGHSDFRGDVDGLNISSVLKSNNWSGETPLAWQLISYYFFGGTDANYLNRAQFFIDSGGYTTPRNNASGFGFTDQFYTDVCMVAVVFELMGNTGLNGCDARDAMVQAFEEWLNKERAGLNPLTDGG